MIMTREEVISIIFKHDISLLSKEERESMLLNCWGIEADDPDFKYFSESLQQELLGDEEPVYDVFDERYNILLFISINDSYYGVRNEYLSKLATKILDKIIVVEGQVEKMLECPCCKYETFKERGDYDICPMCFWEDDGNDDPSRYSGPNHMTLLEGQNNYQKYGAVTEKDVQWVHSGLDEIYFKGDR